jgi:hypothetical protein
VAAKRLDNMINNGWLDEGAIGRDPDNDIGMVLLCGAIVAVEDIVFAATNARIATLGTKLDNGLVSRLRSGSNYHRIKRGCATCSLDHMHQRRLASKVCQYLARQAGAAHAGLDDRNNEH